MIHITKPRYSERTLSVSKPFGILRFPSRIGYFERNSGKISQNFQKRCLKKDLSFFNSLVTNLIAYES